MPMERGKKTRHPGVRQVGLGTWHVRATRQGSDGYKHQARRVVRGTLEEALAVRLELLRELALADPAAMSGRPTTVRQYALLWLAAKAERLRAGTAQTYGETLHQALLPGLGSLAPEDVTRARVEAYSTWLGRLQRPDGEAYSHGTLARHWRVSLQLLRDLAADLDLPDATRRVEPPRGGGESKREQRTLTGAELALLLDQLQEKAKDWYAEASVLALTGMRASEVYALRWRDVEGDRLVVRRSVRLVKGVWHESTTKTGSQREFPLTIRLRGILDAHRLAQATAGECIPGPDELVFPASTGGHRYYAGLAQRLRVAAKAAKIDVRVGPQVLRRTFNTLAVDAGVDRLGLRGVIGHSSGQMTARYYDAPTETKARVVNAVDEACRR